MIRWVRDTIAARIALTCGAGLILFQVAILTLVAVDGFPVSFVWQRMTAHIADVTRILDSVAASERPPLVALLDSPRMRIATRPAGPAHLLDEGGPRSHALNRAICDELARPSCAVVIGKMRAPVPSPNAREAQQVGTRGERPLLIEVALLDGQWLEVTVLDEFAPHAALSTFAVV